MMTSVFHLRDKSILVTGGAGFIGSHLVDRLIAENPSNLVVVDNFFLGKEDNLKAALNKRKDLQVIRLDASNFEAMQDLVLRFETDIVFDLATIPLPTSLLYPSWTIATNIGIASTFCELARLGLIDRLLHLSSSEAYGSALYVPMDETHPHQASTPYASSKSAEDLIIQSYIRTFGINATIVRPFNNFGPRQNPGSYAGIIPIIVGNVLSGRPIEVFGDGLQTRDFTHVSQTVDMIVKIFQEPKSQGDTYNVATGIETTVNQLVELILSVMESPNHPINHLAPRPSDVRRHCADVTKTKALLGFSAGAMSRQEIQETVDWYRQILK
jgi:UDP-glucose 4-epimerase